MSMTFATDVLIDASHKLSLQDGPIYYGTCATAASTTAKIVTCANFVLTTGALVFVKFTYANTGAVTSLTMNVNNTGAKPIKEIYNGAIANLATAGNIQANATLLFSYDGTNWVLMNAPGYNTFYGSMSKSEAQDGVADVARVIEARRLAASIKRHACVKVVLSSISSLPKTYSVFEITADHEVTEYNLSVPSAQGSDWTVTTAQGSLTISGTFNGSTPTNVTLYLAIPETVTAFEL